MDDRDGLTILPVAGDHTISILEDGGTPRAAPEPPCLVLVLNASRPLDVPVVVSLAEVTEVTLGRGGSTAVRSCGPNVLRIDLADRAASVQHGRLLRTSLGWTVTDDQSKNGVVVNGKRVASARVGAEDLLEIGNSFFLLRAGAAALSGSCEDRPPALRTLNGKLARELDVFTRLSRSTLPMLVFGETGTGKEVFARAAHTTSERRGAFVAVNCGAIPANLVESELFGARKGAYSGATTDRPGIVAAAHQGTLFLDEIAELPESSQAALLRVLQEGEVVPLGTSVPVRVDVRVVAATHQDLAARIATGRFRDDLYARLRGHELTLPPLRERREDLGLLCATLLVRVAGARASSIVFQRAMARALLSYPWPHNVRELETVLRRSVALLEGGDELRLADLPPEISAAATAETIPRERTELLSLLHEHAGNLSAVARALTTSRTHVRRLLARFAIDLGEFRGASDRGDDDEPVGPDRG